MSLIRRIKMRDLVALAYEISKTEGTEQEHHKAFCKVLKEELLHMEDAELAKILTCALDVKAKEYVVTLRIKLQSNEVNANRFEEQEKKIPDLERLPTAIIAIAIWEWMKWLFR